MLSDPSVSFMSVALNVSWHRVFRHTQVTEMLVLLQSLALTVEIGAEIRTNQTKTYQSGYMYDFKFVHTGPLASGKWKTSTLRPTECFDLLMIQAYD
jgi:hypothetical protein